VAKGVHDEMPYMDWERGDKEGFGLFRADRTGGAKQAATVYLGRKRIRGGQTLR